MRATVVGSGGVLRNCPKCKIALAYGFAIDPKLADARRCFGYGQPQIQDASEIEMIAVMKCPQCGHSESFADNQRVVVHPNSGDNVVSTGKENNLMSTREDLQRLRDRIKERDQTFNRAQDLHWEWLTPAKDTERELIRKIVLEENLLSLATWGLQVHSNIPYLYASEDSRDVKALSDLTETNYHCDFDLDDGVALHFNDGDMSIRFDAADKMPGFIKRFGLSVATDVIDSEIARVETLLASLKAFREYVGGK